MKSESKWIIVLAAALVAASLIGCSENEYRRFESPRGDFRILVMRQGSFGAMMPGQSGDAPGVVRLVDREGHVLQEKAVSMVQLVDQVTWREDRVTIRGLADWQLPASP